MTTECIQCPCLNHDADEGYSCNLGYKIIDSPYAPTSKNCKLISIRFVNNKGEEEEHTPEAEK